MQRNDSITAALVVIVALAGCIALGSGCDRYDTCDALCTTARGTYGRCLEADGRTWADSTDFTSEDDFDNWCNTWTVERRILARTAGQGGTDLDALLADCQSREANLQVTDCDAFFATLLD